VAELKGSLAGVSLLSVTESIGDRHQTGTLALKTGSASGSLAFDDGRLVAARCGVEQGLQAIANCALDLTGAEYDFVEGKPTAERTLDLGPADLKKLLTRVTNGSFPSANGTHEADAIQPACPNLGFADDREHHYSRSTAMHRCYAAGAASLVSAQEQRDLCLSGRFATCPRFRNNAATALTATAMAQAQPSPEPPAPRSIALRAVPAPSALPPMPRGVAARLAAASQVPMSPPRSPEIAPPETVATPPPGQPQPAPSVERSPERPRRSPVLIATAVAAGIALLMLIGSLAVPAMRGNQSPKPAAPAAAPTASAPNPTPASIAAAPVVGLNSTSAPPPRVAASAAPRAATTPPADNGSLQDVRFASGAGARWLANQPYAGWSDGAYRLLAKDDARFVAVGVPATQSLSDVIISATFRKTGGPPGGGYGLIVRDQGPEPRDGVNQEFNAYVLETGDLGEYGVWRRDGDHWVDLVPWTRSSAVRSGGSPNDLEVRAVGDQLSFSVNGSVVAEVTDDAYPQGSVGIFVGGDDNAVALDRFNLEPQPD
jgi:hypothetical protein